MRGLAFMLWLSFTAPFLSGAVTITEDFVGNPATNGWSAYGDTNLFAWNATNQDVEVTWDSAQTNSYFYHSLGTILNRNDDFAVALDLELTDVAAGVNPSKPSTFELAFGFMNFAAATNSAFLRGTGANASDLVEFDFFPGADVISATVWPSFWSTNGTLNYNGPSDYTLIDLPVGVMMHIALNYTAEDATMRCEITTNGTSIGDINPVTLRSSTPPFTDFQVDTFALESYSDAGQPGRYAGSLLAHGTVRNVVVTVPPPPAIELQGGWIDGAWQVSFNAPTNWIFALQRSSDLKTWSGASPPVPGTGGMLVLNDTNAPSAVIFYRVRATRP